MRNYSKTEFVNFFNSCFKVWLAAAKGKGLEISGQFLLLLL